MLLHDMDFFRKYITKKVPKSFFFLESLKKKCFKVTFFSAKKFARTFLENSPEKHGFGKSLGSCLASNNLI